MKETPCSRLSRRMMLEELLEFGVAKHGGRLVEHDDAGVARDRLGDLDHLALGDADRVDARAGIDT